MNQRIQKPGVPESKIKQRIKRLQQEVTGAGMDGVLILQKSDIYYCRISDKKRYFGSRTGRQDRGGSTKTGTSGDDPYAFMGADGQRVRFIGHGIGIELDEFPFIASGQTLVLEEGMVIALEPKLIFPGEGVVGIENTHLVTAQGLEKLTRFDDGIIFV